FRDGPRSSAVRSLGPAVHRADGRLCVTGPREDIGWGHALPQPAVPSTLHPLRETTTDGASLTQPSRRRPHRCHPEARPRCPRLRTNVRRAEGSTRLAPGVGRGSAAEADKQALSALVVAAIPCGFRDGPRSSAVRSLGPAVDCAWAGSAWQGLRVATGGG